MEQQTNEILSALEKETAFISVDSNTYKKVIIDVLKKLISEKGLKGLYVAPNKVEKDLVSLFSSEGIKTKNVSFLKTLKKADKQSKSVKKNVRNDLDQLYSEIAKKCSVCDFVIFDTVDTFLLKNDREDVESFIKQIVKALKEKKKKCVLLGMKEALNEHMLHSSMENLSDNSVDSAPAAAAKKKFEDTFLKL